MGPEPCLGLSKKQIAQELHNWTWAKTRTNWRRLEGCRQAKEMIHDHDGSRARRLLRMSRQGIRNLVGILTGHCPLNRHLHLLGLRESPLCPSCGTGEETAYHLIGTCDRWGRLRRRTFGKTTLPREDLKGLDWDEVSARKKW